jgi:predicted GIY-YIG superfamily endonuclease
MEPRSFYVYILASSIGGTLYIGVTNDLIRRVAEHKLKITKGFTKKYMESTSSSISNNLMTLKMRSGVRSS